MSSNASYRWLVVEFWWFLELRATALWPWMYERSGRTDGSAGWWDEVCGFLLGRRYKAERRLHPELFRREHR